MKVTTSIILLVLAFFGLALYAVRAEENRRLDRRQEDRPVPVERRKQHRRSKSFVSYILWALRALKAKFTR
jgi:hypothetical protein